MCQTCGCTPCQNCGREIRNGVCIGCEKPSNECDCSSESGS